MGHFSVSLWSVSDAARYLGVPRKTVTRWCESGKLPAIAKAYGNKITYSINPQAVELLLVFLQEKQSRKTERTESQNPCYLTHPEQVEPWLDALGRGLMNGKVFSTRTIGDYRFYVGKFFEKYDSLSLDTLKAELAYISPAQYAKRDKVYKALVCLGKYLIREGCLPPEFLEDAKQLRPKRHLPAKRVSVDDTGLDKLLQACESDIDTLIITLLANTGIRASEACQIRIEDIDLERGSLTIQCGKGGKSRRIGLASAVVQALLDYLDSRHGKNPSDFLLLGHEVQPLSRHALYKRIERMKWEQVWFKR